jgi:hypothetical protein
MISFSGVLLRQEQYEAQPDLVAKDPESIGRVVDPA